SLLHYHFQSKEHIFIELQINLYNRISDEIAAIISSHGTTTEKSLRLLDEIYRVVTQKDDLAMHVEIWSRSFSSPKLRRHLLQFREFLRSVFIRLLEALLGDHVHKLPVSIETAADLALYILTGFKFHAGFEEDMERVHRAYADLTTIVMQILQPVEL
ncbi:MAG: TetR/AcrR family transcriptional regulator, partial [Myxococcales bacterium]|nr:TetR/AcrR family transcriptional regulator [Myxococcales bacterium]